MIMSCQLRRIVGATQYAYKCPRPQSIQSGNLDDQLRQVHWSTHKRQAAYMKHHLMQNIEIIKRVQTPMDRKTFKTSLCQT